MVAQPEIQAAKRVVLQLLIPAQVVAQAAQGKQVPEKKPAVQAVVVSQAVSAVSRSLVLVAAQQPVQPLLKILLKPVQAHNHPGAAVHRVLIKRLKERVALAAADRSRTQAVVPAITGRIFLVAYE